MTENWKEKKKSIYQWNCWNKENAQNALKLWNFLFRMSPFGQERELLHLKHCLSAHLFELPQHFACSSTCMINEIKHLSNDKLAIFCDLGRVSLCGELLYIAGFISSSFSMLLCLEPFLSALDMSVFLLCYLTSSFYVFLLWGVQKEWLSICTSFRPLPNCLYFLVQLRRVSSQNGLSAIFYIFKVRALSYTQNNAFLMIPSSLYIKVYIWSCDQKVSQIFLLFFYIFQQLESQISKIDQNGYNSFCDYNSSICLHSNKGISIYLYLNGF